ncbi:EAL domain-containing protein [Permianibacter sp. IMCC34836]|uniref:putative bifunctional diguanylate cyclase/phosphodiesterase n=1 Tax=Permianibacter fluminis TaxID=2738515 RepID=UPI001552C6C5|nr:EAL domain-containing protein [Permianibacter fluminis]NQD36502.1 EAL domain-containing protein [Permianibacter fluminis]
MSEPRPPRRYLSRRLALIYGSLLLLVLAAVLLLVSQVQRAIVTQQLHDDLLLGQGVFQRALEQNQQQLTQAAKVLAADFGFVDAVASRDQGTISSALNNHGRRISADLSLLASLDGQLIADSRDDSANGVFPFPDLLQLARERGAASSIVSLDNKAYQLVVVPVKAPLPVAVVAMGFLIDAAVVNDLQKLTGMQVSIFGRDRHAKTNTETNASTESWQLQASTLTAVQADALKQQMASADMAAVQTLQLGDVPFQSLVTSIGDRDNNEVAVLQRSLDQALAPHRELQRYLLGLGGIALLLALIATVFLARGIVKPLQQLQTAAQRMEAGDYAVNADVSSRDEIGDLAHAFNTMRSTIANREQQILDLAYRDPLTGLPNRTYFTEQLQQALTANIPAVVVLLDIDRFKMINNTLGHALGDELLRAAGARLRALLPDRATLARLGADEYAVLLPEATDRDGRALAEQLAGAMQQPFVAGGQTVDLRASFGYAVTPEDGNRTSAVLRAVDVALYYSRQQRRGIVRFDPALQPFRAEHLSLLGDLRRAVAENELRLYYQPKVNLQGSGHGYCEALVRWQHPTRGFIPPIDFIPFAEQTGDIKRLTRWIVARALGQCREWQQAGMPVNIAINISAHDLLDDSLREFVAESLDRSGVAPERLGLEVTESGFIEEPERAMALLGQLRALGVKLAIDDFGTGYSSLAYLKKLPVQELKIDQAFIRQLRAEGDDAAIVRSTIELGHNLGLQVVAEGIEHQEQAILLRDWGCDRGQGYHFSRPVPADDFRQWLQHAGATLKV